MKEAVIGFDTSNYRTSVAAVDMDGNILINRRELLKVAHGETGLRQSDAVFAHIRQLPEVCRALRDKPDEFRVAATAVSVSPADGEKSYMPVFQAGICTADALSACLKVPCFKTTHQRGHIAAAIHGTDLEDEKSFLAFHLSGGTTDLMACTDGDIDLLGKSADLHAGQLVDRAGVSMGLPFPSGPALEELAVRGHTEARLGSSLEKGDLICHLSGAETQVQRWIHKRVLPHEDIALEIYDLLARTFSRMLCAASQKTSLKKALIAGGIAGSDLFRRMLSERCRKNRNAPELYFGKPQLSGDNAVGVALIGVKKLKQERGIGS